jgi:hypothetical protein
MPWKQIQKKRKISYNIIYQKINNRWTEHSICT